MKKIIYYLGVVLVVMVFVVPSAGYAMKIGYADMELALATTKAGKKAKAKIEKEVAKRRKALEKSRNEIVKLENDFKKQELILSEASKEKKRAEYLKKVEDLRNMVAKNEQEVAQLQQRMAAPILVKMRDILKKISKKKGYDVVISKGALLHASEKDDLTQVLIKQFNKEYKGK